MWIKMCSLNQSSNSHSESASIVGMTPLSTWRLCRHEEGRELRVLKDEPPSTTPASPCFLSDQHHWGTASNLEIDSLLVLEGDAAWCLHLWYPERHCQLFLAIYSILCRHDLFWNRVQIQKRAERTHSRGFVTGRKSFTAILLPSTNPRHRGISVLFRKASPRHNWPTVEWW